MQGRRSTWLMGGVGLISCGVMGMLQDSLIGTPVAGTVALILTDVLWAGAVLLLAIGLNRESSVVARKPLGLAAAVIVALWPLTATVVGLIAGPIAEDGLDDWMFWIYLSMVLPVFAGLIAAVQVARAQVVPNPWNWAPMWVLVGQVVLWALPQVVAVSAPTTAVQLGALWATLGTVGHLAGTLGLGILATVLATSVRDRAVPVFRSSPERPTP